MTEVKDGQYYKSDCGRARVKYSDTLFARKITGTWAVHYPEQHNQMQTIGASFKTADEAIACLEAKGFKFKPQRKLLGI